MSTPRACIAGEHHAERAGGEADATGDLATREALAPQRHDLALALAGAGPIARHVTKADPAVPRQAGEQDRDIAFGKPDLPGDRGRVEAGGVERADPVDPGVRVSGRCSDGTRRRRADSRAAAHNARTERGGRASPRASARASAAPGRDPATARPSWWKRRARRRSPATARPRRAESGPERSDHHETATQNQPMSPHGQRPRANRATRRFPSVSTGMLLAAIHNTAQERE